MVNFDDHVQNESWEEDEIIRRVISEQTQILIDCQEASQKALIQLRESLQALRDYHSKQVIKEVEDKLNGKAPF